MIKSLLILLFFSNGILLLSQDKLNKDRLLKIPGVVEVNELPQIDFYTQVFEVYVEQYIDYSDTSKGTFHQRFSISHSNSDSIVIIDLEGYALYSTEANEISEKYKANQICIEHRYFDQSKPESAIDWNTLTVQNAAQDQHRIIELLKKYIYTNNKFVSTGISKGGQTAMLHHMYYPNDIDGSICYVAPLNFEREDPRIYGFLKSVGTSKQRKQIKHFQIECLKRKDILVPVLGQIGAYNGFSWKIGVEKAFEYYVLEYPFAFWQWGKCSFESIPGEDSSDDEVIQHLLKVSGISFFEDKGIERIQAFFCAGMSQMGIYGYECRPFKKYLSQQTDYTFEFTLPEGYTPTFSNTEMIRLDEFIHTDAENIIFIYGELDTWTATAVDVNNNDSRNIYTYTLKGGHHGTRIENFSSEEQELIWQEMNSWVYIK